MSYRRLRDITISYVKIFSDTTVRMRECPCVIPRFTTLLSHERWTYIIFYFNQPVLDQIRSRVRISFVVLSEMSKLHLYEMSTRYVRFLSKMFDYLLVLPICQLVTKSEIMIKSSRGEVKIHKAIPITIQLTKLKRSNIIFFRSIFLLPILSSFEWYNSIQY